MECGGDVICWRELEAVSDRVNLTNDVKWAYKAGAEFVTWKFQSQVSSGQPDSLSHLVTGVRVFMAIGLDCLSRYGSLEMDMCPLSDILAMLSPVVHCSTSALDPPQCCVLSPLLFSLYTNGCTSGHQSVKLLKFADDTTLIGLIFDGDESAYRGEMDHLVSWCSRNNLELNSLKTVEMIVDFRKDPAPLPPVIVCDSPVTSVESFCFLGTTITKELKWEQNIREAATNGATTDLEEYTSSVTSYISKCIDDVTISKSITSRSNSSLTSSTSP
ncbi:hypothetical protein QTP70_004853 [Hemibagrus guttatus]|uniref:Reverse transcriptase domain-containing protein n=1 Tax=Hemibagrus guttatus TaxID=175788 RepID=A0AAE0RBH3_9TELE|nr:hypothetical protein QTP70_004853 [Hemibagrus guttatus]